MLFLFLAAGFGVYFVLFLLLRLVFALFHVKHLLFLCVFWCYIGTELSLMLLTVYIERGAIVVGKQTCALEPSYMFECGYCMLDALSDFAMLITILFHVKH